MAPENVVILLVGSKADLTEERAVSNDNAQAFADSSKMKYIEASAKDNTKINESFNYLMDAIIENIPKEHDAFDPNETINQPQPTSDNGSSSRCRC